MKSWGNVKFNYMPTMTAIGVEVKTPKPLAKRLKKIIQNEDAFNSDYLHIDEKKIVLVVPISSKYRLNLLPENPVDIDYILLFADELILSLNSIYKNLIREINDLESKLYYTRKYVNKIKRDLDKIKDIDSLKKEVSTDAYYYMSSYIKGLNYQLYQFSLQKRDLEVNRKLMYLILDVLHYIITKIVTTYPLINVDYADDKYVIIVNDTKITLRDEHYDNVREIIDKNKDIFRKAIAMYKSDIIEDINKAQNELIHKQSVLENYNKILDELEKLKNDVAREFVKIVKKDINFVKREIKMNEEQIKDLKGLLKATDEFLKKFFGGEESEQGGLE